MGAVTCDCCGLPLFDYKGWENFVNERGGEFIPHVYTFFGGTVHYVRGYPMSYCELNVYRIKHTLERL